MVGGEECCPEAMAFGPDIVVTERDGWEPALVVEAKVNAQDLESTERQLKTYMFGTLCPVGLIVTPSQLRLYRNRYLSSPEDSVELVGAFDVRNVLHYRRSTDGREDAFEFEGFVQAWLEGLGSEAGLQGLPAELRRAAQWYIFPAVSEGDIQAAHPRPPASVS
jgi:hypothetical protein